MLVLVCLYGLVASLRNNGWEAVSQYTPQTAGSFMSGLSMTVGSFALGAVIAEITLNMFLLVKMWLKRPH